LSGRSDSLCIPMEIFLKHLFFKQTSPELEGHINYREIHLPSLTFNLYKNLNPPSPQLFLIATRFFILCKVKSLAKEVRCRLFLLSRILLSKTRILLELRRSYQIKIITPRAHSTKLSTIILPDTFQFWELGLEFLPSFGL
jgi:hypothetical protein